MNLRVVPLLVILLSSTASSQEANSLQTQKTLKFASYLHKMGEYERSASELQKAIYYNPINSDSIYYAAGYNFLLAGHFDNSKRYLKKAVDAPQNRFFIQSQSLLSYLDFKKCDYQNSIQRISTLTTGKRSSPSDKNKLLLGANYILLTDWEQAEQCLAAINGAGDIQAKKKRLQGLVNSGRRGPYKSPAKAAFFSTVIPGSGKLYAGRSVDGLFSFLLIVSTSYLAYDGFENNRSGKAWTFTGFTGIFYISNIYGSYINAKIYNSQKSADISMGVNLEIDKLFLHR